ncbi:MAG: hypothetical protein ACI8PT_001075 [Gammaproteobacteria bacterium]|jgi:hypothetical protein
MDATHSRTYLPASSQTPQALAGPDAWHGEQLRNESRWHFSLDTLDVAAIESAVVTLRRTAPNATWQDLRHQDDFPISLGLSKKLADVAHELEHGRGVANLSGLPVERYSDDVIGLIWMGLARHLGTPLPQDYRGLLMRDITDEQRDTDQAMGHVLRARDGSLFTSSKARTASNGPLRFHTDRADVVGLLCVHGAREGGVSKIASSVTVHNVLLSTRPDLARVLYEPYARSRHGEELGGEAQSYDLPVFGVRDGRFTSHYSRTYVEAAQELASVARMSPLQWEALDALAAVAEEVCFETTMAVGDMQFLNNHVIYHARTAYQDSPDSRRCLRRVWLSVPTSRALPVEHAVLWKNVEAGTLRGGIAPAK